MNFLSEKLGQVTSFGAKLIVVHQPHIRIRGEDILVTITCTSIPLPVVIIKSEFSILRTTKQYNYDILNIILFYRNVI